MDDFKEFKERFNENSNKSADNVAMITTSTVDYEYDINSNIADLKRLMI
jgi:hypothetical protein